MRGGSIGLIDLHEVTTAHYAESLAHAQRTVPWQWEARISPSITIVRSSA